MPKYLRDTLTSARIDDKLDEINAYHPNLKFTCEREEGGCIPFLDMKILHSGESLTSTWYRKPTDTGLTMNFHSLAPKKYKRSVVSGMIYRIKNACSTEDNFKSSIEKAKILLRKNQYPPSFFEPIIAKTLEKISNPSPAQENEDESEKKKFFVQYRGKVTEQFERTLRRINAPVRFINTIKKLRSNLPSLKAPIEKSIKSGVVYQINCSRCQACYVGQTVRHLITRVKEHKRSSSPVGMHFEKCNTLLTIDDVEILAQSLK